MAGQMGVEFNSVRVLARQWGSVPKEFRDAMRPRMRMAGEQLRGDVQAAAGFSERIPGAVRVSTAFGSKTGGVRVWVNQKQAPHARPLENLGQSGTFRHPLFGDRDVWVEQQAHPFFFPTIKRNRDKVTNLVADAVRASFPRGAS